MTLWFYYSGSHYKYGCFLHSCLLVSSTHPRVIFFFFFFLLHYAPHILAVRRWLYITQLLAKLCWKVGSKSSIPLSGKMEENRFTIRFLVRKEFGCMTDQYWLFTSNVQLAEKKEIIPYCVSCQEWYCTACSKHLSNTYWTNIKQKNITTIFICRNLF